MLRKIAGKAKAALGMTGDFRQKWQAYRQANKQDKDGLARRLWDEIGEDLQRLFNEVAKGDTEEKLEAKVAGGESILPRMTVSVIDGVAYAADGTNEARKASGVCVGVGSRAGTIYWQATGNLACKVKRSTGVSSYGVLYQSATKGWLTNDSAEVGLEYVQPVGTFVQWLVNPLGGNTSEAIAVFNLNTTVDGSDPDYPVTSVNGKTGDVVLELNDLDDVNAPIPNQGDLLSYEAIDVDIGSWKPRSILDAVQFVNIGDLADVDDVARTDKAIIQFSETDNTYYAVSLANTGLFCPTRIGVTESFTVPANKQVLFAEPIDVEGVLNVDGTLVEVD